MKTKMFKCPKCSRYTLDTICPDCEVDAITPLPPRYSPTDKYGSYRRAMKKLSMGD